MNALTHLVSPLTMHLTTEFLKDLMSIVKDGYVMWYDILQGQWARVYISLSETSLTICQNSSRFARILRPPVLLADLTRTFCSVDAPDAPERHVPVLGVYCSGSASSGERSTNTSPSRHVRASPSRSVAAASVNSEVLLVFRTPERRLMAEWWAALAPLLGPHTVPDSVAGMASLRSLLPPQLYGLLFRASDEKVTTLKKRQAPEIPATVHHIASMSAMCPKRGPIGVSRAFHMSPSTMSSLTASRASPLPSARRPAAAAHVDPASCATPRSPLGTNSQSTNNARPTVAMLSKALSTSSILNKSGVSHSSTQRPTLGGGLRSKSSTPVSSKNTSPVKTEDIHPTSAHANTTMSRDRAAPPEANNKDTAKGSAPQLSLPPVVSAPPPPSASTASGTAGTTGPATLASVVAPLAAANDKDSKIKEQRSMIDSLSARNIDLEIDQANMTAHVLELEGTIEQLRASVAEWRRKHQSLEQQLDVQERDFERRLAEERSLLTAQLQEEVQQHLVAMKEKWDAKEAAYKSHIAALVGCDVSAPLHDATAAVVC